MRHLFHVFANLALLVLVSPDLLLAVPLLRAQAIMSPTQGNQAKGVIIFTKLPSGVRVDALLTGLTPGKHGLHIHEIGDCSAPDASSAGAHFNPTSALHGDPHGDQRHTGDLGNIEANERGDAKLMKVFNHLSFEGDTSIIGKSVIVHAEEDDLVSQPTGNSGGRLACGIIKTGSGA